MALIAWIFMVVLTYGMGKYYWWTRFPELNHRRTHRIMDSIVCAIMGVVWFPGLPLIVLSSLLVKPKTPGQARFGWSP